MTSRREVLRSAVRAPVLIAVGWVAASLAARRSDTDAVNAACALPSCDGCRAFSSCGLPRAFAARKRHDTESGALVPIKREGVDDKP